MDQQNQINGMRQRGVFARTSDVVTDVARTSAEVAGDVASGIGYVVHGIQEARRPGRALDIVAGVVRQAPLTSICIALLGGIYLTRRR